MSVVFIPFRRFSAGNQRVKLMNDKIIRNVLKNQQLFHLDHLEVCGNCTWTPYVLQTFISLPTSMNIVI